MNTISLAADANFLPYAHVVMESVRKVSKQNIEFVLLFCGGNSIGLEKIKDWANENKTRLKILFVEELNFSTYGVASYLSKAAFARLLLPQLLPNHDKVLYLDCDIFVRKDLEQLFTVNLHGNPFAAFCEAPYLKTPVIEKINPLIRHLPDYFNSGVLVCDLQCWREINLTEKLLQLSNTSTQKMYFADQDLLNLEIKSNYTKLSGTYNAITRILCRIKPWSLWVTQSVRTEFNSPHIIHFTDPSDKPWKFKGRTNYSEDFRKVMRELGYEYKLYAENISSAERFSLIRQTILGISFDSWLLRIRAKIHIK